MGTRAYLKMLRRYNQFAVEKNAEGMTLDESLQHPEGGGNSFNWVLGHILFHRDVMLEMLGGESVMSKEHVEPYARGSHPPLERAEALDVETLLGELETAHSRIDAAINRLSDEELDRPREDGKDGTIGSGLLGLQFHESYHAGQLGVLRRLAGKGGALA